jgi:hypothetical protein
VAGRSKGSCVRHEPRRDRRGCLSCIGVFYPNLSLTRLSERSARDAKVRGTFDIGFDAFRFRMPNRARCCTASELVGPSEAASFPARSTGNCTSR